MIINGHQIITDKSYQLFETLREMTEQEIESGNKLIALFMGADINAAGDFIYFKLPDNKAHFTKNLQYHSSWDWLMPVVEKIEAIGYWTEIHSQFTTIGTAGEDDCVAHKTGSRIEATWLAVIDFIKFYNSQSPTS